MIRCINLSPAPHFRPHGTPGSDDNWPGTWLSLHFDSSLNSRRGRRARSSESTRTSAETSLHITPSGNESQRLRSCTSCLIVHQGPDSSAPTSWTHNELSPPCWTLTTNTAWADFVYLMWTPLYVIFYCTRQLMLWIIVASVSIGMIL